MPSVNENLHFWNAWDWTQRGEEWSSPWGGSAMVWGGTLFPRISRFLPVAFGLEIAPGFGRFTHYLKNYCTRLMLVDLTPRCVEACKERFASSTHIDYLVNDGMSLKGIPDGSVDFAFSYDSLVHCEVDVIRAYLEGLAKTLTPQGVAFLHHSNLAEFAKAGRLPFENPGWRGLSVSGDVVIGLCAEVGLCCFSQERINWLRTELTDCFSLLTRVGSRYERPTRILVNRDFTREVEKLGELAALYAPDTHLQ